ncbi:tetratricopeptide repeat protein [Aquimarina sp. 2201CG5-10]|uniref:tetratricopeptide repeat protein n=1 Tax=Aquimarina callyspongiae TaxID=3098150 RepID=UPI002AB458FB|nr:tetratricopeptide repeat protein [Aquimarina sp. 2201CG5-10]MDY8134812.1 tetratricopeptide repeat protein [Aquimarina sp. 2201CG5-10]
MKHQRVIVLLSALIVCIIFKAEAQSSALAIADSLYTVGDYTKAIKTYNTITPKDQYLLLQIAKSHKAKGTYIDALTYYKKAIENNSALISAKLEYAKLLTTTNKFNKADSVYTNLISEYPKNPNFQYRQGLVKKIKKDSTAILYFKEAFKLDSTHQKSCFEVAKHYLKKREYDKVWDVANLGLHSYPENPQLINILGQNFLLKKDYDGAIPYFEKLLQLNYESEFIHASAGLCYSNTYEFEKAVFHFKEALKYDDKIPIRYTRLGDAYLRLKKHKEAIESYEAAITLKDLPIEEDLLNIAMVYRHQKQWQKAIKYATLSLKENPGYSRAQYQLATFADAYYEDPQTKLDYYNLYLKKHGDDKKSYLNFIVNKRVVQLEEEINKQLKK